MFMVIATKLPAHHLFKQTNQNEVVNIALDFTGLLKP